MKKTKKPLTYNRECADCRRERRAAKQPKVIAELRKSILRELVDYDEIPKLCIVYSAGANIIGFFFTREGALKWIQENQPKYDGSYCVSFGLRHSPEIFSVLEYLVGGKIKPFRAGL